MMIAPFFFALAAAVAGDWTGTSLCTNREVLPGCHDETVVYHFTKISDEKVHLIADKIVDGKPEYMGEFDLDVAGNRLTYVMKSRQGAALWDFTVDGDRITGTLTMPPGKNVVRKIDVKRK